MVIEFLFLIKSSVQLLALFLVISVQYFSEKEKLEPRDNCLLLYILVSSY